MADPIFIFSSGQRCGSTLLQRLLNSHKDILIWGEQHGSIIQLYEMNNKLLKWESNHRAQRKIYLGKGYDNFTPNLVPSGREIIDASRDYLLSLFAKSANKLGKKIWGFKEVRYDYEISCFLLKLFPNAKIIWLTRNVVDCFISLKHWENTSSSWTREWTEIFLKNWERINESFLSQKHLLNTDSYLLVRYEDLILDKENTTQKIFDFINIPSDEFNYDVFNKKIHSGGKNGMSKRNKITRKDLSEDEWKLILTSNIINISTSLNYDLSENPAEIRETFIHQGGSNII